MFSIPVLWPDLGYLFKKPEAKFLSGIWETFLGSFYFVLWVKSAASEMKKWNVVTLLILSHFTLRWDRLLPLGLHVAVSVVDFFLLWEQELSSHEMMPLVFYLRTNHSKHALLRIDGLGVDSSTLSTMSCDHKHTAPILSIYDFHSGSGSCHLGPSPLPVWPHRTYLTLFLNISCPLSVTLILEVALLMSLSLLSGHP